MAGKRARRRSGGGRWTSSSFRRQNASRLNTRSDERCNVAPGKRLHPPPPSDSAPPAAVRLRPPRRRQTPPPRRHATATPSRSSFILTLPSGSLGSDWLSGVLCLMSGVAEIASWRRGVRFDEAPASVPVVTGNGTCGLNTV
ncbi:unnamed protein product [Gadus morhua 'NCC']